MVTGKTLIYKEIQKRTFQIYSNRQEQSEVLGSKGMFSGNSEEVTGFMYDQEIFYNSQPHCTYRF